MACHELSALRIAIGELLEKEAHDLLHEREELAPVLGQRPELVVDDPFVLLPRDTAHLDREGLSDRTPFDSRECLVGGFGNGITGSLFPPSHGTLACVTGVFKADPLGFVGTPADHVIDSHRSRCVVGGPTLEVAVVVCVSDFVARVGDLAR